MIAFLEKGIYDRLHKILRILQACVHCIPCLIKKAVDKGSNIISNLLVSAVIRYLRKKISQEEEQWVYRTFESAVNQEKQWAEYLFKDGSMIGLNDKLLHQYVEWVANRRLKGIGLRPLYDIPAKNNPLPWTEHWLNSKGLQVAPQETEISSYLVGGIKQDMKNNSFSGFKL